MIIISRPSMCTCISMVHVLLSLYIQSISLSLSSRRADLGERALRLSLRSQQGPSCLLACLLVGRKTSHHNQSRILQSGGEQPSHAFTPALILSLARTSCKHPPKHPLFTPLNNPLHAGSSSSMSRIRYSPSAYIQHISEKNLLWPTFPCPAPIHAISLCLYMLRLP